MIQLSVIIPSYNVSRSITRCLKSLEQLHDQIPLSEVIFVDDCSTDDTVRMIEAFREQNPEWVVLETLDVNSGTPSVPRNAGIELAKGKYVFHLDPDDEILPDGIIAEMELADRSGADFVRAPLIRDNGQERRLMNNIDDWGELENDDQRNRKIVREHSTTVCSLYNREFLLRNKIYWPVDLRLAEDAIFLYTALTCGKVEYSEKPDFVYHTKLEAGRASSTQQYQERELENHLKAWEWSSRILSEIGIDYFQLRGQVALSSALQNMIRFNWGGFTREAFIKLSTFLNRHSSAVKNFTYGARFTQICDAILEGRYEDFLQQIKLRLLIAGYDLRFILPAIPELADFYQIQVDEWSGHETHDVEKSNRLLNWADVIHCEWMLGNAVWYSQNKRPRQGLAVRLHRFETTKPYGSQLNMPAVDRIITIAPGMFEETQQVFNFNREKMVYVPNYIECDKYKKSCNPLKVFNLVMVGSVPKRKGYHRALELLKKLREVDDRYTLTIYGRKPQELGWVINDPAEREYFAECDRYTRSNGLENSINFGGWVDTKTALAENGFILSMSEAEGSHVAAAEGFASGNITVLYPWEGADYMYPQAYIFDSIDEMRDYILECRDFEVFEERRVLGYEYVKSRFSMERFKQLYTSSMPTAYSVP